MRRYLGLILMVFAGTWPAGDALSAERASGSAPIVALTFDDLPVHAALPPGMTRADVARSVIAALKAHHAPPTFGFVNAKRLEDGPESAEVLRMWRAAGHPLGSHSFSHMDANANPVEAFEADVVANEAALQTYMGSQDWHWFRYPYLREGETPQKRQTVAAFLKGRGYRVAEVSLNFDDWAFSDPYARCMAKKDVAAVEWMKAAYIRRATETLVSGPEAAKLAYGRDIGHVMLLHIGAFETVMLPRLLDLLDEHGFRLVTLQEAESDPAYADEAGAPPGSGTAPLQRMAAAKPSTPDDTLAKLAALCP